MNIKRNAIVGGSVALLALGVSGTAAAEGHTKAKANGKTFATACGATWGQVVSSGQPRTEDSTHYRSGYKGGVQGLLANADVLAAHLPLCPSAG